MTGTAYATSAEMARFMGAFAGYAANRDAMLRVIRNHRRAAHGETAGYEGLAILPVALDAANCPDAPLVAAAKRAWDRALALGEQHGFRNAQVSVIAPTGTIGLVMDCDTTGIEPDFALVKFKKLAGGGYFKIINQTVPLGARARWATTRRRSPGSSPTRSATARSPGAPAINHETLAARGFDQAAIERVEKSLGDRLRHPLRLLALHAGRRLLPRRRWASTKPTLADPKLDVLARLGFSRSDIAAANVIACGTMTDRGRARSQARASRGVRLCKSLWTRWHALLVCGESHTHDGCSPAVRIGRDLQDHQHAQRSYGRGLPQGL